VIVQATRQETDGAYQKASELVLQENEKSGTITTYHPFWPIKEYTVRVERG
jgi:hypothetical protein